jgi:hypothetical protein
LPDIIDFIAKWEKTERFRKEKQLLSTGINYKMIDKAMSNFISEIMNKRTIKSSILCAKDPQFIDNVKFIILNYNLYVNLTFKKIILDFLYAFNFTKC